VNAPSAPARVRECFPSLRELPPPLAARVAAEAQPRIFPDGTPLFDELAPCTAFPLVLEGAIRVTKRGENGRELLLYRVGPGESCVLTTSCLLGRADYRAAGFAEGALEFVALSQPLFEALIDGHRPFREFVFGMFSERIVELMMLVEEVAFSRLDRRLAALLLERGPRVAATQQSLADELGSVREIIGRVLRSFEADGLVRLARGSVEVADRDRLRRLAGY